MLLKKKILQGNLQNEPLAETLGFLKCSGVPSEVPGLTPEGGIWRARPPHALKPRSRAGINE